MKYRFTVLQKENPQSLVVSSILLKFVRDFTWNHFSTW